MTSSHFTKLGRRLKSKCPLSFIDLGSEPCIDQGSRFKGKLKLFRNFPENHDFQHQFSQSRSLEGSISLQKKGTGLASHDSIQIGAKWNAKMYAFKYAYIPEGTILGF